MMENTMPEAQSKFRLVAELGRGGMGHVYLAVVSGPAGFNKLQVVKRLRPDLAGDPESVTMFLDEARLAARLSHPNVVQTNEVGQEGSNYFIAMEYLAGQSLDGLVRRARKSDGMPLDIHLRILCDALSGLHYAHELADFDGSPLGLVHRDVTPHNIFITYDGVSKLLDFGIAKVATAQHETRTGMFKGKCAYMPAEQIGGDSIDRRADLFSVGAVLWHALTGERLWKGETDINIFRKVISGDIPSPRTVKPDVDPLLEAICMKALAPLREDRFSTALEMQGALEEYMEANGMRATHREVARFVNKLFASERATISAAVDAQLRAIASSPEQRELLTIPALSGLPDDLGSLSRQRVSSASGSRDLSSVGSLQVGVVLGRTGSGEVPMMAPPPRRKRTAVLGGLLVAAVAALTFQVMRPLRTDAVAAGGSASAAATTPSDKVRAVPSQLAPDADFIEIHVASSPATAQLFLDDAPLPSNPFNDKFVRDGATHRLRAEATGFRSKTQLVSFKGDRVRVDLSLDAEPAVARPTYTYTPRPQAAPQPPKAAPEPTQRTLTPAPHVAIDTTDPWK
jgi:serine/threonine protein kinase